VKTVHFDLKDVDGVVHAYEVDLFTVAEQARLQIICAKPLFRALGKVGTVISPALKSIPAGITPADLDMAAVVKIMAHADLEAAAEALMSIPEMLVEQKGPDLITRIFAGTRRCVEIPALQGLPTASDEPIPTAYKQELRDSAAQDQAFGDGNMAEYWQAAAMVLIVNFTQYGRKGSRPLSDLLGKLTGGILTLSPKSTETEKPSSGATSEKPQPGG